MAIANAFASGGASAQAVAKACAVAIANYGCQPISTALAREHLGMRVLSLHITFCLIMYTSVMSCPRAHHSSFAIFVPMTSRFSLFF